MQNHGEPSVDEILESIKKVIARDSEARAEVPQRRRSLIAGGAEPVDSDEAEDVLELGAGLGEELIIEDDAGLDAVYGEEPGEDEEEGLIADATRSAMQQNFAALTMLSKPGKQPQIVRQGETSLEGLVRDMLRPMLSKWLDENLPGMVEDLVKAEIARIAGKKR
jgi:cell pole-organizing protein PopZ